MASSRPQVLVDALSVASGGGKSYAINLLRELEEDDRGFDFTIALPEDALEDLPSTGARIDRVALPAPGNPLRIAGRILYEEFYVPLRGRRFDVVYAVADLLSPLPTSPTVVALRNLNIYDHTYYGGARLRTLRFLAALGAKRATRTIFPSQAAADLIGDSLGLSKNRIRIVPHGVDASAFDPGDPFHSERRYLFLPSAIERHKNLETLVEALPYFSDSSLEVRVAGGWQTDPDYHRMLHERANELGVGDRFVTMGPVPYREIAALYRGAKALVFPSWLAPFGHPILEAMTLETPVVASNIPAFLEVGGPAAAYFERDDPKDLARAVDELDRDTDAKQERVTTGVARAEQYSWKNSVDQLCEVLEEAAEAP